MWVGAFLSETSVARIDGGRVAVGLGDPAVSEVVVEEAEGEALPVGSGAEADTVIGCVAVGLDGFVADGATVTAGVRVRDTVAVAEAAGAAGVGVASSLAAWPTLAKNTESAISMASNCLTAEQPPGRR